MKQLFASILRRRIALLVVFSLVAVLGFIKIIGMPRSLFPELNYPRVLVEVNMGYAPLETTEWSVTSVLEKELRAVPGVRLVKSSSSRGQSSVDVFLNESEDVTTGVQRVNAKIAEARAVLPVSAQISVRPITASAFPSGEYCFTSQTMNAQSLRTFVEYTIKPQVMVLPGVFNARVFGGSLPEISINLDAKKMAAHNLTVADVNDRLKNSNAVDFLGPINTDDVQVLAFGGKLSKSAQDIQGIVVDSSLGRAVKISDLGSVKQMDEWRTQDASLNGDSCVGLDIFYQDKIDQKSSSAAVAKVISDIVHQNGTLEYRSWDLNDFTDLATNAVLIDLAVGMVIIALVTLIFLKSLKFSLISLVVMPLAASLTFICMSWLGLTINLMTLGGLTAAIGLVVDNTVIVLEMYYQRKMNNPTLNRLQIMQETLLHVAKPMLFGTATIALVFTPISYLSGVSGMFFSPMAHVHSSALLVSVLIALMVVPGIVLLFDQKNDSETVVDHSFEHGKFSAFYRNTIAWCLDRSKTATMLFLLIPLIAGFSILGVGSGFLPEWDEGDLVIDFRAESPTGLENTIAKIRPVEDYLKTEVPEIDFFIRKVGTGLGSYNKVPYEGEIIVKLKNQRSRSVFEIKDDLLSKVGDLGKGLEFDMFQILPDRLNDLSGSAKPIVVYLRGDESKMDEASKKIRDLLSTVKGLDSVRIEEPEKSPEKIFSMDERKTRALELNPTVVNENIRSGLFSLDSTSVQMGPQSVPVRIRTHSVIADKNLESMEIYSNKGGLEQVKSLGVIETQSVRTESYHIDGTPVRILTAELAGRDLGSVVADIKAILKENSTPGVYVELAGDYEMQQKSFKELSLAFLTGLAIILITALFFSNRLSVALPLTVAALVPPVIGLLGCFVFKIPLDVSSFSGLISVTGISVANSFMAFSAIEDLVSYKTDLKISVLDGMCSRLRPILMTNLAAMAGFVPIAIGLAQGDEILRPFSIAIIWGLVGAIYTTLILMPTFYFHFAKYEATSLE